MFLLLAAAPVPDATVPAAADVGLDVSRLFSLTGSTPCYDVYTHNGAYWMCSACGITKPPSESKCRLLSAYQVLNGRWCS